MYQEAVDFLGAGKPHELRPDTAIFYATHPDPTINLQQTAEAYGRANGGVVMQDALEDFSPGNGPNSNEPPPRPSTSSASSASSDSFSSDPAAAPWFKIESGAFAEATRGSGKTFLPAEGVPATSYWITMEWPQLQKNNIPITWIDYTNNANTKILWQPGDPKFDFPANTPMANIGIH
jgi:hypothetical protein